MQDRQTEQWWYLEFPESGGGLEVQLKKTASLVSRDEQAVWWLTLSFYYVPHLKIKDNIKSHWESRSRTLSEF